MTSIDGKTTDIRIIFRAGEFKRFCDNLSTRVKNKFEYIFGFAQTIYASSIKYTKHLDGANLYEMRISVDSSEYRMVLFAIGNSSVILSAEMILLNGLLKKSTGDYDKQTAKAVWTLKDLVL